MSISAGSRGASAPLAAVLRHAGAVVSVRDGFPIVLNYGSAAAELAVCLQAVGLVDRSELTKLLLEGPARHVDRMIAGLTGGTVATGGALFAGGAWWCGTAPGRVAILAERPAGNRLRARLLAGAPHHVTVTVHDRTDEWAAIALLGRHTGRLLDALGVYGESGDPRRVPPFTSSTIGAARVRWLLQSQRMALALLARDAAGETWRAIERVGRPLRISCVGSEAARRYALLERAGAAAPSYA